MLFVFCHQRLSCTRALIFCFVLFCSLVCPKQPNHTWPSINIVKKRTTTESINSVRLVTRLPAYSRFEKVNKIKDGTLLISTCAPWIWGYEVVALGKIGLKNTAFTSLYWKIILHISILITMRTPVITSSWTHLITKFLVTYSLLRDTHGKLEFEKNHTRALRVGPGETGSSFKLLLVGELCHFLRCSGG